MLKVEKQHRTWGCEIIQEAGLLLRFPQVHLDVYMRILQSHADDLISQGLHRVIILANPGFNLTLTL